MEVELNKRLLRQDYHTINKLLDDSVNQETLNLGKMLDSLNEKLSVAEKTFDKNDVVESSKRWSEILLETKNFVDFALESYRDLSKELRLFGLLVYYA